MPNLGSGGLQTSSSMFNSFVPEIWTEGVRYYFQKKLILAGLAMDWSSAVANGGDKIHIPKINEQSADSKAQHSGGALTWTNNTTDEGSHAIDITNHHYSGLLIEDVARIQANDDLMSKYTQELGYALAKKIEVTVEAGMNTDSQNVIELSTASSTKKIAKADIGTIIKTLVAADIDYTDGNTYLVLGPDVYSSLFELDDFARYDVIGNSLGAELPRVSGFVGKLAGVPVFTSTVVGTAASTTLGYLFHKSFSNIAFSQRPRMQDQYDIDYLGTKVVTDAIYGWQGIDEDADGKRRAWKIIDNA